MNDVRCPRCGGANPPNAPFCNACGSPVLVQPPLNSVPLYAQPPGPPKIMGEKTKWALGLGIAALLCCGPLTGGFGLYFAKSERDEIRAGRAPNLDEKWAERAFYLNIVALILWVMSLCFFWGLRGTGYMYQ